MWTYQQSTGKLKHNGALVGTGYSGGGAGKNNPLMADARNVGPIPCGRWKFGPAYTEPYEGKMPPVMHIIPEPGTDTFGRDGFLLHGDSVRAPGTASEGCIIMAHDVRVRVSQSPDRDLEVVP